MRVLVVTKIFPSSAQPGSAPFNRQQFTELSRLCDVEVLATIPWFPGARLFRRWSDAGQLTDVPSEELVDGLPVRHPRFLYVPKVGVLSGPLYAASLARAVRDRVGKIDVVLGAWAYPDGYAALEVARRLGVPGVVKLHGSDINVLASRAGLRTMIRSVLRRANRVVAVSRPLARRARELGADRQRIDVVRNGVDGRLFRIGDAAAARHELGLPATGRWILYVGRLEKEKGVFDLLGAYDRLRREAPEARLVFVGDGSARHELVTRAARVGGVRFAGQRPLAEVATWITASDLVCLPSWNEGMPNAVLEALSCGRRAVATRVGGVPDVLRSRVLGELVDPHDPVGLWTALGRALREDFDPLRVRTESGVLDWRESAESLLRSIERAASGRTRESKEVSGVHRIEAA